MGHPVVKDSGSQLTSSLRDPHPPHLGGDPLRGLGEVSAADELNLASEVLDDRLDLCNLLIAVRYYNYHCKSNKHFTFKIKCRTRNSNESRPISPRVEYEGRVESVVDIFRASVSEIMVQRELKHFLSLERRDFSNKRRKDIYIESICFS